MITKRVTIAIWAKIPKRLEKIITTDVLNKLILDLCTENIDGKHDTFDFEPNRDDTFKDEEIELRCELFDSIQDN
jgi:hypothetical protein